MSRNTEKQGKKGKDMMTDELGAVVVLTGGYLASELLPVAGKMGDVRSTTLT